MENIQLCRFAIKYNPSVLAIEFKRNGKMYIKKFHLKHLNKKISASFVLESLIKRFPPLNSDFYDKSQVIDFDKIIINSF